MWGGCVESGGRSVVVMRREESVRDSMNICVGVENSLTRRSPKYHDACGGWAARDGERPCVGIVEIVVGRV